MLEDQTSPGVFQFLVVQELVKAFLDMATVAIDEAGPDSTTANEYDVGGVDQDISLDVGHVKFVDLRVHEVRSCRGENRWV